MPRANKETRLSRVSVTQEAHLPVKPPKRPGGRVVANQSTLQIEQIHLVFVIDRSKTFEFNLRDVGHPTCLASPSERERATNT